MHAPEALRDIHDRAHHSQIGLLRHCRALTAVELNRQVPGFGDGTVRLQFRHAISAEEYWLGVIRGDFRIDDDEAAYPTVEALEAYRARVYALTEEYLRGCPVESLNAARPMRTWSGKEPVLVPAHVILRTVTHLYHHQGQIAAMCRILGKPIPEGLDFPLVPTQELTRDA
ncbi:MAG: DinB family protein [bacterium]